MKKGLKLEIFLRKSELRRLVWEKLNKPKTAIDIAKELRKHRSSVSRVLSDMKKSGFIKCINPEDKSFRFYEKR